MSLAEDFVFVQVVSSSLVRGIRTCVTCIIFSRVFIYVMTETSIIVTCVGNGYNIAYKNDVLDISKS